jgi:diacylglycerol O-acyltransferase / wax synthase
MTELAPEQSLDLSAFDYVEYRMEMHSQLRTTVMSIDVLDGVPEWQRLRDEVDRASRLVPRLRQHVVAPVLPVGTARWVTDPDMSLDYHLRRVSLPSPGSFRQLLELAQTLHATPMDLNRPLWEATFVEGLREGPQESAAIIWKFSRPVIDGMGGVALDRLIHASSSDPARGPMPPLPSPQDLSPGDLTRSQTRRLPLAAVRGLRSATGALVGSAAGIVRRPQDAIRQVAGLATSLNWASTGPSVAPSALLKRRSTNRRFETLDVSLEDLRAAARPHGYSVHDAYVAAVCGGLRLYHEKFGVPVAELSLVMPIALGPGEDAPGGDLWSGLRMAGPVGEVDPVKRMRVVRDSVLTARAQPAFLSLRNVAPLIAWLPTQMMTGVGERDSGADLYVASATGQPRTVYVAGARVDRVIPISPLLGGAIVIVMYSLAGRCHLGINVDAAAVTDPAVLVDCLRRGFEEVIESATGTPKARRSPSRARPAARTRSASGAKS